MGFENKLWKGYKVTDKEYRKLIKKLNDLMDFASNLNVTHKKREYAEFRIKLRSAYKLLGRIEMWVKEIKKNDRDYH